MNQKKGKGKSSPRSTTENIHRSAVVHYHYAFHRMAWEHAGNLVNLEALQWTGGACRAALARAGRAGWWGVGPIFREVEVNLIGEVCDVGDPASNQHNSKSSNHYTTAPLVINQAQLDWPRREGFSCKRIEEHEQERINSQSEITDVYEAKINMGFKFSSQKD